MPSLRRAFTLIELLIVVAIIAILAAIAVPNFLEAQTRAKVSRVKSDLRSIATAIESNRVDVNRNPNATPDTDLAAPVMTTTYDGHLSALITTPIAYITSLPIDAFKSMDPAESRAPFHYAQRRQSQTLDGPAFFESALMNLDGAHWECCEWFTFSHGPDLDEDTDITLASADTATQLYDPTNGTVSSGDIYNLGPCIGFLR